MKIVRHCFHIIWHNFSAIVHLKLKYEKDTSTLAFRNLTPSQPSQKTAK